MKFIGAKTPLIYEIDYLITYDKLEKEDYR